MAGETGVDREALLREAGASVMGRGSTDVQFVTCVVNRENLDGADRVLAMLVPMQHLQPRSANAGWGFVFARQILVKTPFSAVSHV